MKSPAATGAAPQPAGAAGALNSAMYLQVQNGQINVKNGGGSQSFTAGQFGFAPGTGQPPVILPQNPGMKFAPPPSFQATAPQTTPAGASTGTVSGTK